MRTAAVILFPPTHEQSLPTFHVREGLRSQFIEFLEKEGFKVGEPPEHLDGTSVAEVLLEAGTPMDKLTLAKDRFLKVVADDGGG